MRQETGASLRGLNGDRLDFDMQSSYVAIRAQSSNSAKNPHRLKFARP
jgi:hypothetical protein